MASEMMQAIRSMIEGMEGNDYYATEDFAGMRAEVDQMSQMQPIADGVEFEGVVLGGVACDIARAEDCDESLVVLYLHGGAFITGNALDSRGYISDLADCLGCPAVGVSYRCAPEHPFPAAPEDCFAVYRALLERFDGARIVVVGDSAGATLALDVAIMARCAGVKLPFVLGLYSPVTSYEALASHKANAARDVAVDANLFKYMERYYVVSADAEDELVSPLNADMQGMPPMQITVDESEILLDDALELAAKAARAGVLVKLTVFEGCIHAFPSSGRMTPESCHVMDELKALVELLSEENDD